jgi:hypothetical protein
MKFNGEQFEPFVSVEGLAPEPVAPAQIAQTPKSISSHPLARQIEGIYAEGQAHRRDAERAVAWRLQMNHKGFWSELHEIKYQQWRRTEMEFWQKFRLATEKYSERQVARFFRHEWTTRTGCQVSEDTTRLAMLELEIEL